jgi:hypothetical protein
MKILGVALNFVKNSKIYIFLGIFALICIFSVWVDLHLLALVDFYSWGWFLIIPCIGFKVFCFFFAIFSFYKFKHNSRR